MVLVAASFSIGKWVALLGLGLGMPVAGATIIRRYILRA
jgi:hypothetical protein